MKAFEVILANISKHIQLTPEERQTLLSYLNPKQLKRNEAILSQGKFCKEIYFVNNGMLRAHSLSPEGKEITVMFAATDWWITDMHGFIKAQKSMVTIEALIPSSVYCLSKVNFDKLFDEIPKFEHFFRILMQNAYIREQLRTMENLSLPAKEKYHLFMTKYPEISNQLTQKQIASYLGITPEFLSMIRSKS